MSIVYKRSVSSILLVGLLMFVSTAWSAEMDGRNLFEKRCAACHKLPDPGQPPATGWAQQLELMAPLARLKKEQKQDVLDYLLSHTRSESMTAALDEDRAFLAEKCAHCHTLERIFLSRLRGDDLQHVVSRMQNRSGTDWLSDNDVDRVLGYLNRAPDTAIPAVQIDATSSAEEIFSARCSACHTLERIFDNLDSSENSEEFWSHTVSRMRGKAPQWMGESEADKILDYLRSVSASTRPVTE